MPLGGGGIGEAVSGFFGGGRATRVEQFAQIALAEQQLESMFQMLEAFAIGKEIAAIFDQMSGITGIVDEVLKYEPPVRFTQDYATLTPQRYSELEEERMVYLEEVDAEIRMLEAEIALNEEQMSTLAMGMNLVAEPRSDISATQAQTVADAARLEQQRRQIALDVLRSKRADLKEQLEIGSIRANRAAMRCVEEGICGNE